MITKQCKCDKCGEIVLIWQCGIYIISHESFDGRPIMGDNRILEEKHFCRDCFGKYLAPLLN